jgi:Fatty acid desaturase
VSTETCSESLIPALDSLGDDLLTTSRRQRRPALARPFIGIAVYGLASYTHLWWLTPFLVFLIFVAVVTVTHDVVHGSLRLWRRQSDWALFATGAVLLESGHAYRATHLRHHLVFPSPTDPEDDPARLTLFGAILSIPKCPATTCRSCLVGSTSLSGGPASGPGGSCDQGRHCGPINRTNTISPKNHRHRRNPARSRNARHSIRTTISLLVFHQPERQRQGLLKRGIESGGFERRRDASGGIKLGGLDHARKKARVKSLGLNLNRR